MSAKPVKAPVTSLTKASNFRRVSPRVRSAFTPVQSNAARLRATNTLNRAKYRTNQSMIRTPAANHSPYFGIFAAYQRMQMKYRVSKQKSVAMNLSTTQSQQLKQGDWARKQSAMRSGRQQIRTLALLGMQKSMRAWVTSAAGATPKPVAVARVTSRTRNTSAAAKVAQSRRAQIGNKQRKGKKYKKGGASSGSVKQQKPVVSPRHQSHTNSRTRTSAPVRAVKTPKAARYAPVMDTPWVTAGNDRGVENCAAVAIANHLWYHHGKRMTDEQVNDLTQFKTIVGMLKYLVANPLWDCLYPSRWAKHDEACIGDIVVYRVGKEYHAGLLLPDRMVVSWGEEVYLPYPIKEAWFIKWRRSSQSERP